MSEQAAAPGPGRDATSAARPAQPVLDVEEVRVAMALNGGVSLAVWMGGCAVEIDCARRAHLGEERIEGAPTRRVYHALCAALQRELVVDVMSGSSAGGINGALLAAATVSRRRLHPDYLRDRWLELGDIGELLHPLATSDPKSLMRGDYFYEQLEQAFHDVLGDAKADPKRAPRNVAPNGAPELDPPPALDVTTTDVAGQPRRFRDVWGDDVTALEYRARFRFRENEDYVAKSLANAARSSASFPLAFEPFVVEDEVAQKLASFAGMRSVIDGGLLDNAPIAAAIDLVKVRPAYGRVKRYVCYVNGEPKDVTKSDRKPDESRVEYEMRRAKELEPDLTRVVANVVGLPRKAPFADQLLALDDIAWRGRPTHAGELELLTVPAVALRRTAAGLLPMYRDRRRMLSLRELLPEDPAAALAVWKRLQDPALELPWIPVTVAPPPKGRWGWGVQTARRAHHLALDVLRGALDAEHLTDADREALLRARMEIYERVAESEQRRTTLGEDAAIKSLLGKIAEKPAEARSRLQQLAGLFAPVETTRRQEVLATGATLFGVRSQLRAAGRDAVVDALFGRDADADELTDGGAHVFLSRVLGIEVVRRAFAMEHDVDDGQQVAFAQLTPLAPTPLLDPRPLGDPRKRTPEDKLTGIRLAHFSAFHRRSWRANDFMWGRLDGAARVVGMLFDPERARARSAGEPWRTIAAAVLPDAATEAQAKLVDEALRDDPRGPAGDGDLRARLEAALERDILDPDDGARGTLTAAVCMRAAQLEVLVHELPVLVKEAADDVGLGASTGPLELSHEGPQLWRAIEDLRHEPALPDRLGRDDGAERVSNLALTTISRSGLVSLALLRGSGMPLMGPIQILRALFLSIAGMVTRDRWYRIAVVAALFAASLLLTARAVTTGEDVADLGLVSIDGLILALIALLVVGGVASVPTLRAIERGSLDRVAHGAVAAVIVICGGLAATGLAWVVGDRSPAQLIVAVDFQPGWWVTWAPVALVLGYSTLKMPVLGRRLPDALRKPWVRKLGLALVGVGSALVVVWSVSRLLSDDANRDWWGIAASFAPLLGLAVATLYVFLQSRLLRAGRRRELRRAGSPAGAR